MYQTTSLRCVTRLLLLTLGCKLSSQSLVGLASRPSSVGEVQLMSYGKTMWERRWISQSRSADVEIHRFRRFSGGDDSRNADVGVVANNRNAPSADVILLTREQLVWQKIYQLLRERANGNSPPPPPNISSNSQLFKCVATHLQIDTNLSNACGMYIDSPRQQSQTQRRPITGDIITLPDHSLHLIDEIIKPPHGHHQSQHTQPRPVLPHIAGDIITLPDHSLHLIDRIFPNPHSQSQRNPSLPHSNHRTQHLPIRHVSTTGVSTAHGGRPSPATSHIHNTPHHHHHIPHSHVHTNLPQSTGSHHHHRIPHSHNNPRFHSGSSVGHLH